MKAVKTKETPENPNKLARRGITPATADLSEQLINTIRWELEQKAADDETKIRAARILEWMKLGQAMGFDVTKIPNIEAAKLAA